MQPPKKIGKQHKPRIIFILGGPGSGKGTQSQLIQQFFGFTHMSAGQLLRQQRQNPKSQHGQIIEKYMIQGTIVPCQITVKLLQAQIMRKGYQDGKFLIDGFPRNFQNLRKWHMKMHPDVIVPFIVVLHCGEACLTERLIKRGKTSGRIDDKLQVIKKRFVTYNTQTQPVINYYQKYGKAIIVNAEQSVEDTFKEAKTKILERLNSQ